jgi:hypothetical protein
MEVQDAFDKANEWLNNPELYNKMFPTSISEQEMTSLYALFKQVISLTFSLGFSTMVGVP